MKKSHFSKTRPVVLLANSNRGVALIEVMVSIMIFSFGVVGLIGLQSRMNQVITEASFRATAAELAQSYVNQVYAALPANRAAMVSDVNKTAFDTRVTTAFPGASPTVVAISPPFALFAGQPAIANTVTVSITYSVPGGANRTLTTNATVY